MSYKTFKITYDWLLSKRACGSGLEWFNYKFPNGLTISNSQEEMIEMLLNMDLDDDGTNYLVWLLEVSGFDGYIGFYPYGKSFGVDRGTDYASNEFKFNDVASIAVFLSDLKELA